MSVSFSTLLTLVGGTNHNIRRKHEPLMAHYYNPVVRHGGIFHACAVCSGA